MRKQGSQFGGAKVNRSLRRAIFVCSTLAGFVVGGLALLGLAVPADAAGPNGAPTSSTTSSTFVSDDVPVTRVSVTVNKSRTFQVARPFTRAIVGQVDLADVLPLSDRSIYIQGKKVGTTNVSLLDADARLIGVLDLDIGLDTNSLEQKIRSSTGGAGIRVSSNQGQVVLSGLAADAVMADKAMQVAKGMAGEGSVVNAMSVAPSQQVMLEVRFLEATREAGRELGVNWFARNDGSFTAATGLGRTRKNNDGTISVIDTLATGSTPFGAILANVIKSNGLNVDVLVSALEEKGMVRRLAEPNLIALSGDTARFHAGGEFPVPVSANTGALGIPTVTIEFKPFGVRLNFTPTVLSRGIIHLRINPEVSEPISPTLFKPPAHSFPRLPNAMPSRRSNCVTAKASPSPACYRPRIRQRYHSFPGSAPCRFWARCSAAPPTSRRKPISSSS